MELNEDFIAIQGIFLNLQKEIDFKSLKHRGGNEQNILRITAELHKLLSSKDYIKDQNTINAAFDKQLNNIILFLLLNTNLKIQLEHDDQFTHLMHIMPQLTTCLLANIVILLDLEKHYCSVLQRFSLETTEEVLPEIVVCLKHAKPDLQINNTYVFVKYIIVRLSTETKKVEEHANNLAIIVSEMMWNLTGVSGDLSGIKKKSLYHQIGFSLLKVLKLLLLCDPNNPILFKIIEKMLSTCCSIMMAVTLDVFCSWTEIKEGTEPLQSAISGKAYLFIEKYQKIKFAKELTAMLATIAKKPLSLKDLVQQSDVPTMIQKINQADSNQKAWFVALLNTQVLSNPKSVQCLNRWAHLCTKEDVCRLLNQSTSVKDADTKKVVIKSAATLDLDDLVVTTTRHFFRNGTEVVLNDNIQPQLIITFNKLKEKTDQEEFSKGIYLLLLQSPNVLLSYLFAECLKNRFYCHSLRSTLLAMKEIASVNSFGLRNLNGEISKNLPDERNCGNFIELLNTLIDVEFFSAEGVALEVILPLLQKSEGNYELLKSSLEVLNGIDRKFVVKSNSEPLFTLIFNLMANCRCKFLEFTKTKQDILKESLDYIEKYKTDLYIIFENENSIVEDSFISFYKSKILQREDFSQGFLQHLHPNCRLENHAENVSTLIKLLPVCVIQEWFLFTGKLIEVCGAEKTIEVLCDCLILLSQLVNSQSTKTEELKSMINALKYCLQNTGIVIKECVLPKVVVLDQEVEITKHICRLLRHIPENLKSEEGISLAHLLTDRSLQALKCDKKFACQLVSIKEPHICQMLAQKMLNTQ